MLNTPLWKNLEWSIRDAYLISSNLSHNSNYHLSEIHVKKEIHIDMENESLLHDVRFSIKEYAIMLCVSVILHKAMNRWCSAKLLFTINVPWKTEHDFLLLFSSPPPMTTAEATDMQFYSGLATWTLLKMWLFWVVKAQMITPLKRWKNMNRS